MNSAESFSASYDEARAKFLGAVKEARGAHERLAHPERGPEGGEISTDVAWFGPKHASRVLVLISGTHGVEGYCGSGAQVDWLRRGQPRSLPADTAALLVHAINPFGFAWNRRVTEDNVDLNRNWIDFSKPLPANAGYDALHELACPREWSESVQTQTFGALLQWAQAHGMPAFQAALSGGQYRHPKGIFFGGAGPTWSRRTLTEIWRTYCAKAARVGIIDYHTGLGPWGFGEQIAPVPRETPAFARAVAWFGGAVTSPSGGTSASADISGDGLSAAVSLMPHAEVTCMALEVGTVEIMQVMQALRADAWLHAYGDVRSAEGAKIKAQIRAAFYGDADDWKGMVAGQSLLAVRQALVGLNS